MAEDKDIFDFNAPAEEVESPTLDKDTTEVSEGFDFDAPAEMVSPTDIVSIGTGEEEPPKPQEFQRTQLSPEQENDFQNFMNTEPAVLEWKEAFKNEYGEYPDIEDADYDYRGAWESGQVPVLIGDDPVPHWGSFGANGKQLKSPDHPTRWKSDYFELTGDDPDETDVTKASAVKALKAQGFPVSNYMITSELNEPQVKISLRRLKEDDPDKFNAEVDGILKKENKFNDIPPMNKKDKSTYFGDFLERSAAGGLQFLRDKFRVPSLVYDIKNFGRDAVADYFLNRRLKDGELTESQAKEIRGLFEQTDPTKSFKDFLDETVAENEVTRYLEQHAEKLRASSQRYDKSIEAYLKTGEYSKALGAAGLGAGESLVPTIIAAFTGGAGLVDVGLTTGAGKKGELDEVSDVAQSVKTANAILTGSFEAITERIGTHQIGGFIKSIYKDLGKESAEKVIKEGFIANMKTFYKKLGIYTAPVQEGLSEAANQFLENITDITTGVNPDLNPFTGVVDAFSIGTITGAGFSAAAVPGKVAGQIKDRKAKNHEDMLDEIMQKREGITPEQIEAGQVEEADKVELAVEPQPELEEIQAKTDELKAAGIDVANLSVEEIESRYEQLQEPEVVTPAEAEITEEVEPAPAAVDLLDQPAKRGKEQGIIKQEGQQVVFETPSKIYELGNIDELRQEGTTIEDLGITVEQPVEINEFGDIQFRDQSYTNKYTDKTQAINFDDAGNVVSVNLENEQGQKRTFRGQAAEDLAYAIYSQEFFTDPGFESFIDGKREEITRGVQEIEQEQAAIADEGIPRAEKQVEQITPIKDAREIGEVREEAEKPTITPTEVKEGEPVGGVREIDRGEAAQEEVKAGVEPEVKKRKVSKPTALKEAQSIQSLEKSVEKGDLDLGDPDVLARVKTAQKNNLETNEDATEIDLEVEAKKAEAAKKFKEEEQAKLEQPKGAGFMFLDVAGFFDKKGKVKPARPISALAKKYFTKEGDIPAKAFKEHVQAEARLRARQFDIEKSVKDMIKRTERTYGRKLKEEEREQLSNILENIGQTEESLNAAMSELGKNMPKEMIPILVDMRQQIDNYTDELSKLNMIGVEMEEKFDKNRGYYVTRTYKKHSDRKWTWENIPAKIKEDAFNVVADLYPEFSVDEVTGTLKSYLADKDIVSSVISNANSLKDVNRDILKKRSAFLTDNPEIRAFLGENKDPFYNYAVSLTKMSEMIERGKMMQNIVDIGVKDGWLAEKPSDEKNLIKKADYKAKYKTKPDTKELADYYTTPEIAEALSRSFAGSTLNSKPLRVWMRGVTTVKMAKTVFSLKGIVRNFLSNPINAVANGNWNVQQIAPELTRRLKNKDVKDDFYRELYERGVIGDTVTKAELIKNIQELSDKLSYISNTDENVLAKQARKTKKIMMDLYGLGDDVWKAYRYVSEYTRYENAFKKTMSDKDAANAARTKAVDVLHKTSAYYANLPLALQNFRKIPFSNTFISWPYLTLTNAIGSAQIATQELKTPGIRHIGAQRMVGLMGALGAIPTIAALINRGSGQDEEDMEAWRRFLPEFWKNDIIAIDEVKDGKALYVNRSFMDYYGVVTTPINTIRRKLLANGTVASEDLIGVAGEFAGNFISYDILFDKMTDLKNNQSRTTGFPIYNEQDDWLSQWRDISGYILETFEPGTLTDVRRIYKDYRIGEDWQAKAEGVFKGTQVRTIDPIKSMDKYKLYDYRDAINNSRKIYTDELRSFNRLKDPNERDREALKDAKKRALNSINKIVNEIKADRRALNRLAIKGADNTLWDLMTDKRFDTDIKYAVFDGYKLKLSEEGKIE